MKFCSILLLSFLLMPFARAQTTANPQMGYTYKVDTGVAGQQVYITNQRPFNTNGELVGAGNLSAQTQQVFTNVVAALDKVGMTMRNVKQVSYHLRGVPGQVDVSASQLASSVGNGFFGQATPGVQEIKSLEKIARDDILIEVEVIAVK